MDDFRDRLIAGGLLFPTGIDGLWGRSETFERIHDGLDRMLSRTVIDDAAEVIRFPPAMAMKTFEQSGYMKNFPHFAGTVHCFCGDERAHHQLLGKIAKGESWTDDQTTADLVLTPAACYPVYPLVAQRGPIGDDGHCIDVASFCFRHEPSLEPGRLQFFRIREFVRIGTAAQVMQFRERWMERAQGLVAALDLPFTLDVANDPFFGRAGRIMADSQRSQELKFELLVPVNDDVDRTACSSFNYHMTYFGETWGIRTVDGEAAHTACVGFGMERLVLALLRRHGFDIAAWPFAIRDQLGLKGTVRTNAAAVEGG